MKRHRNTKVLLSQKKKSMLLHFYALYSIAIKNYMKSIIMDKRKNIKAMPIKINIKGLKF